MKGMQNEIPLCMKAIGTFRNGVDIPEGENNKNDRKVRKKKSTMRSESIVQQDYLKGNFQKCFELLVLSMTDCDVET